MSLSRALEKVTWFLFTVLSNDFQMHNETVKRFDDFARFVSIIHGSQHLKTFHIASTYKDIFKKSD